MKSSLCGCVLFLIEIVANFPNPPCGFLLQGFFFGRTGESDRAAGETSKRRVHRLSHFILIAGWNRTGTVPAHRGRNASRQPGENSDICGAPPSRHTPNSRKTPRRGIYISHPPTRIQLHTHTQPSARNYRHTERAGLPLGGQQSGPRAASSTETAGRRGQRKHLKGRHHTRPERRT